MTALSDALKVESVAGQVRLQVRIGVVPIASETLSPEDARMIAAMLLDAARAADLFHQVTKRTDGL